MQLRERHTCPNHPRPVYPKTSPLTSQLTPKLHMLPPAKPATKQNAASVPAMSFSSSAIRGFSAGEEARIMLIELTHLLVSYSQN